MWSYPGAQAASHDYVSSKTCPFPSFLLETEEWALAEPFVALGAKKRHLHFNRYLSRLTASGELRLIMLSSVTTALLYIALLQARSSFGDL